MKGFIRSSIINFNVPVQRTRQYSMTIRGDFQASYSLMMLCDFREQFATRESIPYFDVCPTLKLQIFLYIKHQLYEIVYHIKLLYITYKRIYRETFETTYKRKVTVSQVLYLQTGIFLQLARKVNFPPVHHD